MYQHSRWSVYIVGLVAILVYVNTLVGGFTFDDNFAVINNGDVTSDSNPLSDLFKHDFWGQDIASPQSHKSYRPVTILVFRWTRHTWNWVVTLTPWLPQLLRTPGSLSQQDALSDKPARPAGVSQCRVGYLHLLVCKGVLAAPESASTLYRSMHGTSRI
eukprot:GHRR01035326.1.p1 GENE.GHRR01035326.1~~GHRR01035326.1.p1  ORF type:complete len:159 (+),score=27.70 GHRR01035326.1:343-819(+)